MHALTLYGNAQSGHSYKVRLALALGGIAHHYRHVDLTLPRAARPADFQAASRWGEVPVLLADGTALVQSNAILQWLAEQYGVLAGAAGETQALREWLCWEANRIGLSLPNLRYARRFEAVDAAVEAWLEARCRADLAVLDNHLGSQPFLLAGGLSIADLSASAYLWWLDQAGLDIAAWPQLAVWLIRIAEQPGWQHPDVLMAPVADA